MLVLGTTRGTNGTDSLLTIRTYGKFLRFRRTFTHERYNGTDGIPLEWEG